MPLETHDRVQGGKGEGCKKQPKKEWNEAKATIIIWSVCVREGGGGCKAAVMMGNDDYDKQPISFVNAIIHGNFTPACCIRMCVHPVLNVYTNVWWPNGAIFELQIQNQCG